MTTSLTSPKVAGFSPLKRNWVTVAKTSACASFAELPPLDGVVVTEASSLTVEATDPRTNVQIPCAVLYPGSVSDIAKMIRYCRQQGIKVAARGQTPPDSGQCVVDGLVIETQWLNAIHSIGPDGVWVDAGALWMNVSHAAHEQGLALRAMTRYTLLSVGDMLAAGSVSDTDSRGMQLDQVQELEVVTGKGDIVTCSVSRNSDLLEAVLDGFGQCAIITKAKLDLVPLLEEARAVSGTRCGGSPSPPFQKLKLRFDPDNILAAGLGTVRDSARHESRPGGWDANRGAKKFRCAT